VGRVSGDGQVKSLQRGASNVFFDRKKEWSHRKHESLEGYMPQFARILGQYYGPVFAVDGFAGQGFYGTGADREKGSPLLFAEIAEELKGYELRCINVELLDAEFENLMEATAPYARHVDNRHGSFAQHVESILEDIGAAPAFFFLDPFGLRGLEWATLSKVGTRNPQLKTEMLINFMAPRFDLDAGWLFSTHEKTAQQFLAKLDRVMGPLDWRRIWQQERLPRDRRFEEIAELYCSGLRSHFSFKASKFAIRAARGGLKYYLVFATRSDLARRIMGSVLYGAQQRYLEALVEEQAELDLTRGRQLTLGELGEHKRIPMLEELEAKDVEQLTGQILALLREQGQLTFAEIQDCLIEEWFARMTAKHHRLACNRLREQGSLTWDGKGLYDYTRVKFV